MRAKNNLNRKKLSFSSVLPAWCCRFLAALSAILCLMPTLCEAQSGEAKGNLSEEAAIVADIKKGSMLSDKLPKEAFQYLSAALEKSKKKNYSKGIALASASLGRWFFGNDVGKSIKLASEALQSFEHNEWGTTENIADMHLLLAEAYDEQGIKDSSAYYYYILGSEMDAGNITDPEFAVMVFTKLTIFWVNLDYSGSVNDGYKKTVNRFVEKAKIASTQIKDTANAKSIVYFIQGAYHHGLKEFDSARYYYKLFIKERERIKRLNMTRKISSLFNIADTYLQESKPEEAL